MASVPTFSSPNLPATPVQESQDARDGLTATIPPEDLYGDLYEDPYEYDEFLHKAGNPRSPSRMTSRYTSRRSISDSREY